MVSLMDDKTIKEVVSYQAELSGGWVSFPYTCICVCGYDLRQDPRALSELISGCRECNRSYCE